jgi:hypothetical protein
MAVADLRQKDRRKWTPRQGNAFRHLVRDATSVKRFVGVEI